MKPIDLTGQRFGRLVVVAFGKAVHAAGRSNRMWACRCDCGIEKNILSASLLSGKSRSCGCAQNATTTFHGKRYTPEYGVWSSMRDRCENPKASNFKDYGGRGISVCDRWRDFASFLADMGIRPGAEFTIERLNNDKGYEPSNCEWATRSQQALNRRVQRNNSSGVAGVRWCKRRHKWIAEIWVNGKAIYVGSFNSIETAAEARRAKSQTVKEAA